MTDRIAFGGSSGARALRDEADKIDRIAEVAWEFVHLCRTSHLDQMMGPFEDDGSGWAWGYLEEALKGQAMMEPEMILQIEMVNPRRPPLLTMNRRKGLSQSLRTAVFERDEYACVKCGVRRDLAVDHIIPVVAGGTDDLENLQTLCKPCNSAKGARLA